VGIIIEEEVSRDKIEIMLAADGNDDGLRDVQIRDMKKKKRGRCVCEL